MRELGSTANSVPLSTQGKSGSLFHQFRRGPVPPVTYELPVRFSTDWRLAQSYVAGVTLTLDDHATLRLCNERATASARR